MDARVYAKEAKIYVPEESSFLVNGSNIRERLVGLVETKNIRPIKYNNESELTAEVEKLEPVAEGVVHRGWSSNGHEYKLYVDKVPAKKLLVVEEHFEDDEQLDGKYIFIDLRLVDDELFDIEVSL